MFEQPLELPLNPPLHEDYEGIRKYRPVSVIETATVTNYSMDLHCTYKKDIQALTPGNTFSRACE